MSSSPTPNSGSPLFPDSQPDLTDPNIVHLFQVGHANGRYLTLCACSILLYDYSLTFRDEVKHFWRGPWTLTRCLFLFIRYSTFVAMLVTLDSMFQLGLNIEQCTSQSRATIITSLMILTIGQATLVIRVYHLYSFARYVQYAVLSAFGITFTMVITLSVLAYGSIEAIQVPQVGCATLVSNKLWKAYLPQVIMDSIIFAMTLLRSFWRQNPGFSNPFLTRIISEGGAYFAVVFATVTIGGMGTTIRTNFGIVFPAVYSNLLLTVVSVSTQHLLLSIRSLAEGLSTDPDWLLNHIEVSRLALKTRKGATAAELVVNIDDPTDADTDEWPGSSTRLSTSADIMMTRVGVFEREGGCGRSTEGSVIDYDAYGDPV